MPGFLEVLRTNRNYRALWSGQLVSEIGDHFNNIAVFSLIMANSGSGAVVTASGMGAVGLVTQLLRPEQLVLSKDRYGR